MKDFGQHYLQPEPQTQALDPYLYTSPEVQQELLDMQGRVHSLVGAATLAAMLLTAPLTAITASLQLSVRPHSRIYEQPGPKGTHLAKTNTSLTVQERRRMELVLRAGGERRPYAAPVYEGYRAVFRGLAAQGWQAFFKGTLFRSVHTAGHSFAFYEVGLGQANAGGVAEALSTSGQLLKLWAVQLACDCSLNVFHLAENRYILQNRIPQFRVFRNGSKVIRRMFARKEVLTACSYHLWNTLAEVALRFPAYLALLTAPDAPALALLYAAEVLTYPLNTAFRRLACQQPSIPGMIPLRYGGLAHALRLIGSEEGVRGLYAGFGLHHLTLSVRLGCLLLLGAAMGHNTH